jgi:hypothetical protein
MTRFSRRLSAVSATAAVVVASAAVAVATLTTSSETTETTATTPTYPQPPWGTRITLGGLDGRNCAQQVAVTARQATKGILFVSGPTGQRWWTKTEVISAGEHPTPVFIKGRLDPGQWMLQHLFSEPVTFRVYWANSNCPNLAGTGTKWNASIVTVKVIP